LPSPETILEGSNRSQVADRPLVSIVIPTFRRPGMLRDLLLSIGNLKTRAGHCHEVLVIDNDPSGSAQRVVEELSCGWSGPMTVRYVHEVRPGCSFARNRGIDEARGEIIAFLDDDELVWPEWLMAMIACLQRTGADCVGGRVLTCWDGESDPVVRRCLPLLAGGEHGEHDFPMRGRKVPGSGNAAFRRSAFDNGLRFSTELGHVGTALLYGEDTQLMMQIQQAGGLIWYCADARITHRVGGERITWGGLVRQRYWFGVSYAIIDRRLRGKSYQLVQAFGRAGKAVGIAAPWWLFGLVARKPEWRLLAGCLLAKQLGYVLAALSIVTVRKKLTVAERQAADRSGPIEGTR
jgi:glycosyltransferase involved in cell wall biosynthesis